MKPLIFISCGQVTRAEVALGRALHDMVQADGRYEPYFAENQSSLEGVTNNILGKLVEADALVAILHPRGEVSRMDTSDTLTRASVWIEQEIAILTALAQVRRRDIRIQLYVKRGVAREGLRLFIMANPYEFDDENEVARHFKEILRGWSIPIGSRALAAAEERLLALCADTGEIKIETTDGRGTFVRVPGCKLVDPLDRAVAARYVQAVETLLDHSLVRQIDDNNFELTAAGFDRARSGKRDFSLLVIQPVVELRWSYGRNEPFRLAVFLRNVGTLIATEIEVTVRCPRKYLDGNASSGYAQSVTRLGRDKSASIRPDGFDSFLKSQRPLIEIPIAYDVRLLSKMTELVEIAVTAEAGPPYVARFSLEQLADREFNTYYALSRAEGDAESKLWYL